MKKPVKLTLSKVKIMQVICKVIRPSTGTKMEIVIPEDIAQESSEAQDATIMTQYIGEEFNWSFIPMQFIFSTDLPDKSI